MHKDEIADIKDSFENFCRRLKDPRIQRNRLHTLNELLFLILCGFIANCDGWRAIERFGRDKELFLKQFYKYRHGMPSDDTIRRFMIRMHPTYFRSLLEGWLKVTSFKDTLHKVINSKISRKSNPLYTMSAHASKSHLLIGQEKILGKKNEIMAIPKLLKHLDIKDAIITIDLTGSQATLAEDIQEAGADYILCLKADHTKLLTAVQKLFANDSANKIFSTSTSEKSRGRVEKRDYNVMACPEELKHEYSWESLKSLIEVRRERTAKGTTSVKTLYYLSSLEPKVKTIASCIRSYWAIENSLHWILDIVFKDDDSTIRSHSKAVAKKKRTSQLD